MTETKKPNPYYTKFTAEEWEIKKADSKQRQRERYLAQRKGRRYPLLTGKQFGLLLVIQYEGDGKWLCLCRCKKTHVTRSQHLTATKAPSCGCRGITPLVCSKCGDRKLVGEMVKDPRKASGIGTVCKSCKLLGEQRWRRRRDPDREKGRAYARQRRSASPRIQAQGRLRMSKRRAAMRKVHCDFTVDQWIAIQAAYDHRCAYCREKKPLTQDHVIPISKGGPHTASNIVPACISCNSSKGARPPQKAFQPHLIA